MKYLRMIKFSHTIFALPFAGIAVLQALPGSGLWGERGFDPSLWPLLMKILICMAALRSAAMGFNRLIDRHFDAANPRTKNRELPSGEISVLSVRVFIVLFGVVFVLTAFWINLLCGLLSPVALLLAFGYSFTKRFTMFCHFFLGLAIGVAPTAAWLALRGDLSTLPLLWTAGLTFYIAGFDILYSSMDADFDRESGLHSMPSRLGISRALLVARISHILAILFFLLAGVRGDGGPVFYATAIGVAGLFALEHILVRPQRLDRIPVAFFHVNAAISTILFIGLLTDTLLTA